MHDDDDEADANSGGDAVAKIIAYVKAMASKGQGVEAIFVAVQRLKDLGLEEQEANEILKENFPDIYAKWVEPDDGLPSP